MRFGSLLLAAFASAAQAQSVNLQFQNEDTRKFGPGDCATSIPVNWTAAGGAQACGGMELWVTARATCGDAPAAGDLAFEISRSVLVSGTGNVSVAVANLPYQASDAGTVCGGLGFEQTFLACARFTYATFSNPCGASPPAVSDTSPPKLIYDARPPQEPTVTSLTPLDGALSVRVSSDSDAVVILLFAKEASQPDSDYTQRAEFASSAGLGRITGLTNNTAYSVQAYAEDAVGNRSLASAVATATPVASEGFFGGYQRHGGGEGGGCSAGVGGTSVLAAFLVLGAFAVRRRS